MLKNPFFLRCFLFFLEPYREDDCGAVARHEQDRAQRAGQPHCHQFLLFKLRECVQHVSCVKAKDNAAFCADGNRRFIEAVLRTQVQQSILKPDIRLVCLSDAGQQIFERLHKVLPMEAEFLIPLLRNDVLINKRCGIRNADVWHSGCRSVAFQPGFCFGFFDEGGGVCEVHERAVSFQKAVLSGRGGAPSGMGQPR